MGCGKSGLLRRTIMTNRLSSLGALLTATSVGLGLTLVAGVAWIWFVVFCKDVFEPLSPPQYPPNTLVEQSVEFLKDGTPILRGIVFKEGGYDKRITRYQDLDGNDITDRTAEWNQQLVPISLRRTVRADTYTPHWTQFILPFSDNQDVPPSIYWYFVYDGKPEVTGYFVGYDTATKGRVGFLGKHGYSTEPLQSNECFQVVLNQGVADIVSSEGINRLYWGASYPRRREGYYHESPFPSYWLFLQTSDQVFCIDLHERTVKPISIPTSEKVAEVNLQFVQPFTLIIHTEQHFYLLGPDMKITYEATIPTSLEVLSNILCYRVADGSLIATTTGGKWKEGLYKKITYITRFNQNGEILSTQQVDLPSQTLTRQNLQMESFYFWLIGSPLPMDFGFFVIGPIEDMLSGVRTYTESLVAMVDDLQQSGFGNIWFYIMFYHLYTLLWAWITWKREEKYASTPGQKKMWVIFVYLFGLPGLLGYLAHRKWPHLDKCSSCATTTPVDHSVCRNCGSEWLPPVKKGTEVYG
jgi:hypothetical protein